MLAVTIVTRGAKGEREGGWGASVELWGSGGGWGDPDKKIKLKLGKYNHSTHWWVGGRQLSVLRYLRYVMKLCMEVDGNDEGGGGMCKNKCSKIF